jgi:hypothetical protein
MAVTESKRGHTEGRTPLVSKAGFLNSFPTLNRDFFNEIVGKTHYAKEIL